MRALKKLTNVVWQVGVDDGSGSESKKVFRTFDEALAFQKEYLPNGWVTSLELVSFAARAKKLPNHYWMPVKEYDYLGVDLV